MGKFVESGGVNALINAGSNIATTLINQAFAEKNRERNYYWNEKAADNADRRQRAQYEDYYSPQAMLNQYQAAGLSPSLMISGSGSVGQAHGGTGGAQGAGVGGLQGAYMSPIDFSQIELNKALAKKAESEAENTDKDTELKDVQILNIVADTNNKKAENRLITAQADLAAINAETSAQTMQATISHAYYNAQKAAEEVRSAVVKADLDEATFDAAYQLAYAELDNTLQETELFKSEVGVNKAQIKEIAEHIRNSQWQTWQIEKEQNRKDAIFEFDKAKFESEVKQWAAEMNIELAKTQIEMVSDLVGYVVQFATCGLSNVTKLKTTEAYTTAQKEIAKSNKVNSKTVINYGSGTDIKSMSSTYYNR